MKAARLALPAIIEDLDFSPFAVNGQRLQKTAKRQGDVRAWLHEKRGQIETGLQLTAGKTRLRDYLVYAASPQVGPRSATSCVSEYATLRALTTCDTIWTCPHGHPPRLGSCKP